MSATWAIMARWMADSIPYGADAPHHLITTNEVTNMSYMESIRIASITSACDDPEVIAYILSR